jgi:phospholipid/cholesterol/gamma-HCH transport system ATP-binding protein
MRTVRKVADRVIMLYPLRRQTAGSPQIVFEGSTIDAFDNDDPRVSQFIAGQAGERILELGAA